MPTTAMQGGQALLGRQLQQVPQAPDAPPAQLLDDVHVHVRQLEHGRLAVAAGLEASELPVRAGALLRSQGPIMDRVLGHAPPG